MNNIEELKKAALGANLHGWTGFEDALNDDGYSEAVSKFIGHCSPSAILALIAQLEAAQKENHDLKMKLSDAGCLLVEWKQRVEQSERRANTLEVALSAANEKLSKPVVLPEVVVVNISGKYPIEVMYASKVKTFLKAAGFTVEGE
ncbi:TPA: hypothetical protein ACPY78_001608 [Yersinia enterocolitica]